MFTGIKRDMKTGKLIFDHANMGELDSFIEDLYNRVNRADNNLSILVNDGQIEGFEIKTLAEYEALVALGQVNPKKLYLISN